MESAKLHVVRFDAQDVIATSGYSKYAVTGAVLKKWNESTEYRGTGSIPAFKYTYHLNGFINESSNSRYSNDKLYGFVYLDSEHSEGGFMKTETYDYYFNLLGEVSGADVIYDGSPENLEPLVHDDFEIWLDEIISGEN